MMSKTETMSPPYRYWLALHPDIRRPIGGVKQVHRLAEALNHFGRKATIIQEDASFHPGWFTSNVSTISHSDLSSTTKLRSDRDVIILPETFLPALSRYAEGIPKIIFNQNGAYSFGLKDHDGFPSPDKVLELYAHPDIKHVICVSRHDEMLLKHAFQLGDHRVSRIINGIETTLFRPDVAKQRLISYMPRKNPKDSQVVVALLKKQRWFRQFGWSLQAINGLSQAEVAQVMQKSLIFLAFGHPEGFGLPLAEAAACGCYLIGYSGLGGGELLHLASQNHAGQQVDFGDWLGFIQSCEYLHKRLHLGQDELVNCLLRNSQIIRESYCPNMMIDSVRVALKRWEEQLV